MAEEEGADNRTEDPTPRRRQKARDEGRIARSHEFGAAVMLLAGAALLSTVAGESIGSRVVELFQAGPSWLLVEQPSLMGVVGIIRAVTLRAAMAMAPLALGLMAAAIVVGLVQSRGIYSWKPVQPDFNRINPLNGFKKVFGADAAINLVKSALKLTLLGSVVYMVMKAAWPHFVELGEERPIDIVRVMSSATLRMSITVGLAFLAIGGLDFAIQFFRHEKGLKMARHEIIQEHKEQEGDPQIKARIRQIARQRARQRMLSQVAKADVVITNPTHIAVALRYDVTQSGAPVVIAMGERKLAERIKAIARKAGVPMVENKPLARALLATASVGAPIPPALYVAVAEILAYVYRLRQRMPAAIAARARTVTT